MTIVRIFVSSAHAYAGHFGRPAGTTPMTELHRVQLVAGRGLVGDRYAERQAGHKGQVTFFAEETWRKLQEKLARPDLGPDVFRRNLLVRDADLFALIGEEFEVQGIRFRGTEYCKPCFWMDQAFAPGTLAALSAWSAGGLRAAVLTDGSLQTSPAS